MRQRQYLAAGATAALTGALVAAPIAPRMVEIPLVSQAARLVAGESILNVPFNLFQDIVNIPNTEIGAMQQLADSLLYSGTWWTASATNIWGEDPGDPGHFMSVVDLMFPFKALSGQGLGELQGFGDYANPYVIDEDAVANGQLGLSQQIALFMNAQIPVSASSDADWSAPMYPTSPITGSTFIDRNLWMFATMMGLQKYPLFDNWFKVPFADLQNGYEFGTVVNPSLGVGENGQVLDGFGFLGTRPLEGDIGFGVNEFGQALNENGNPVYVMPWSDLTFKMDLAYPFQHWWETLQQTPDMNGFEWPSFEDLGRALQTLGGASILAFYPYVPGSPACPDGCDLTGPFSTVALIKGVSDLWPGNTSLEHWLELAGQDGGGPFGMANGPTDHQVDFANAWAQGLQQWFDLGNPMPDDPPGSVDTPISIPISPFMQNLIDFMKDTGVQDFFQRWADLAGYSPVDPADLLSPDAGTLDAFAATAASPDWFTQLFTDLGWGATAADTLPDLFAQLMGDLGLGDLLSLL